MGATTNQIENHIENTRQDLSSNLHELEDRFKSVTDWRQHFRERPMTMLGLAFGGGVLLAAMMGSGSDSHRSTSGHNMMRSGQGKALEAWDNIKGALIGVAATRVKDFVGEVVPGFREHYDRAKGEMKSATGSSAW